MLGPILWNLYIDNLFQQLPTVKAHANCCTLSSSYCCQDSQQDVPVMNKHLKLVKEWGKVWQVNYASEKTQAMVISQSPAASQAIS